MALCSCIYSVFPLPEYQSLFPQFGDCWDYGLSPAAKLFCNLRLPSLQPEADAHKCITFNSCLKLCSPENKDAYKMPLPRTKWPLWQCPLMSTDGKATVKDADIHTGLTVYGDASWPRTTCFFLPLNALKDLGCILGEDQKMTIWHFTYNLIVWERSDGTFLDKING